jgi:hypothetical protein
VNGCFPTSFLPPSLPPLPRLTQCCSAGTLQTFQHASAVLHHPPNTTNTLAPYPTPLLPPFRLFRRAQVHRRDGKRVRRTVRTTAVEPLFRPSGSAVKLPSSFQSLEAPAASLVVLRPCSLSASISSPRKRFHSPLCVPQLLVPPPPCRKRFLRPSTQSLRLFQTCTRSEGPPPTSKSATECGGASTINSLRTSSSRLLFSPIFLST